MRSLYNSLKVFLLLVAFGLSKANAQTTDTTNVFDPALTGTEIVYAALSYIDNDNDGVFDASFNLSDTPITAWGDYATSLAFYSDRITLRAEGTFQPVDSMDYLIVPAANALYHCWFKLDVPNMKYYVYIQGPGMAQPELIYTEGGDFRKEATFIDRWSAIHNQDAEQDYLNPAYVGLSENIGDIPEEIIAGMGDATLKSLTTSIGELSPEFDSYETDYEIAVPYGTTEIQLNTTVNGLGATATMYDYLGAVIENGLVTFEGDGIDVEIIVTTLTGQEGDYVVSIFVDEGQDDPTLKAIETSAGAIEPVFMADVTEYTLIVPKGTSSVDITGVPNYPQAAVEGDGTVTLTNGTGAATIKVTSADESADKTYNITVEEADGSNYALYLPGEDGSLSNVDISGLNLNTLPITIEMWIKPEGTQPFNAGLIFDRPANIGVQYASSWWGEPHAIRFMVNEGEGEQYSNQTTASPATPDQWHHVVVILADSTRMMYLNGEALFESSKFTAIDWSAGKLYLGWDSEGNAKAFKGAIDEVRIWSDSLTAEEIENNKLEVLTGDEENLVAYYNFDIPSSAYAVDLSSNGHNGVITGGTYGPSFIRADIDLDTLSITKGKLYPAFDARVTDYYTTLPFGTTSFEVAASTKNTSVTVSGSGTINVTESPDSTIVSVTEDASGATKNYVIHYVVDTELTLKHSYTFADGTAKDVVGGADGIVNGGTIEQGTFTSSKEGDYITLPAEEIALNEYPSFTIEAYVTNGINDGHTMLTYFGDLDGVNSTWIQLTRPSDLSQVEMKTGSVNALNGAEPLVGENHHYVFAVNSDSMTWYIDGYPIDTVDIAYGNTISQISTANAWIGKSGWAADLTFLGTIYELNIYSGTMPESEVGFRFLSTPIEDSTSDASLAMIKIDEDSINGFASYTLDYDSIFDVTPETIPVVSATASNSKAEVKVVQAQEFPGTATITVKSEDGEYTNVYTVKFSGGVDAPIIEESNIKVYPTQSTGNFVVETEGGQSNISVYSLTGRLVSQSQSLASKTNISVPSKGMYIIRVENKNEVKSFKVVRH